MIPNDDMDKRASAAWFEFRAKRKAEEIGDTEKEELRAFMVDVLHNRLDNNVLPDIAERIADGLVEHFPNFESIFDPTDGIYYSVTAWNLVENTLLRQRISERGRNLFVAILQDEAIRRGLDPKIPSDAETRRIFGRA